MKRNPSTAAPVWKRITRQDNSFVTWLLARYWAAPDHPTKLRLWNWFCKAVGYPKVLVNYADRAMLLLDPADSVQSSIVRTGYYEPEVWEALARYATGNEVFWDVGGHVGSVAIRAALDPRVRVVHCFEPNPTTATLLEKNLALNPSLPIVHHPIALGDRREFQTLFHGPTQNIGQASFVIRPTDQCSSVECRTADDWITQGRAQPPSLMKLDVEGFEVQVLSGAEKLLASGSVKAIVFEAESDTSGTIEDTRLPRLLKLHGYQVRWLRRPSGQTDSRENFLAARAS